MRWTILALLVVALGCDDSESDDLGVGAQCGSNEDCNQDTEPPLGCLTGFKGGYCGLSGCTSDADCPDDAVCVTHTDAVNYCFRACDDKADCNANRDEENESNCSSNIDRADGGTTKACIPPSG